MVQTSVGATRSEWLKFVKVCAAQYQKWKEVNGVPSCDDYAFLVDSSVPVPVCAEQRQRRRLRGKGGRRLTDEVAPVAERP